MVGWNDLPFELRSMVVGYIRENAKWPWPSHHSPYPQLPLVCREWQAFFSHQNFGVVYLNQDRLDDFETLVSNDEARREHVHLILLHVRLPEYDCTVCQMEEEEDTTAKENDTIVIKTLHKFFSMLSTWHDNKDLEWKGRVALDIGVYSPSDGKHGIRDHRFSSARIAEADLAGFANHDLTKVEQDALDKCPAWERTCEGKQPLMGTKRRILATIGDPSTSHFNSLLGPEERPIEFGSAYAINALFIRRHFYRHLSPALLVRILNALPNLWRFRYEPWPQADHSNQVCFQEEYGGMLNALAYDLQSLELFPASNSMFPPIHLSSRDRHRYFGSRLERLGTRLAIWRTRNHELNISCPATSKGFVDCIIRDRTSLDSMRTLGLAVDVESHHFPGLLIDMAMVAYRRMPQLKAMVVYSHDKNDDFFIFFTYTGDGLPNVLWGRTGHQNESLSQIFWSLRRDLAVSHPGKPLSVTRRLPFKDGTGPWIVPCRKELTDNVLHDDSWKEMKEQSQ